MKNKILICILVCAIVVLSICVALLMRNADGQSLESNSENFSESSNNGNDGLRHITLQCEDEHMQFIDLFENSALIKLRSASYLDESSLILISEKFGDIFVHSFAYFDFIGEGESSLVIFGSNLVFEEESYDGTRMSSVFAIINGESHQALIGNGEVWPRAIVSLVFWNGEGSDLEGRPALLFIDRNLAGNDNASLVTFDGDNLRIYWLRPENAQP